MDLFYRFIKSNTWVVILFSIAVSLTYPQFGIGLRPALNLILMLMMFISCLDLNPRDISQSLIHPYPISMSLLIIHLCSPLIIFFLRDYFPPPIYLGLIIATAIPAGRSSIYLCRVYNGLPAKALVITIISNALSYLLVPSLVYLFAREVITFSPVQMSQTILVTIIIPLFAAIIIGPTNLGRQLSSLSPNISIILFFLIIVGIVSPLQSVVFQYFQLTILLSIIITLLSVINFALGYLLGDSHTERITLAITSSYKNYTLGTLLSLSIFTPLVALPSVVYTLVSNLLLIPLDSLLSPKKKLLPHHHQRHRNIFIFLTGLLLSYLLSKNIYFGQLINLFSHHVLIFSFLAGILFASTFTFSLGVILITGLATTVNIWHLIPIATLGAVFFDIITLSIFKDKISSEISPIYRKFIRNNHLRPLLHTRFFAWTLPVISALVIASPLPDELGVSLLGLSEISTSKFLTISFFSHLLGLSSLVLGLRLL